MRVRSVQCKQLIREIHFIVMFFGNVLCNSVKITFSRKFRNLFNQIWIIINSLSVFLGRSVYNDKFNCFHRVNQISLLEIVSLSVNLINGSLSDEAFIEFFIGHYFINAKYYEFVINYYRKNM